MKGSMKSIIGIILITALLSGCSAVSNNNANADTEIKDVAAIKNTNDMGEYMKMIDKTVPCFEPYYKIVFAFENLPDGLSSIPFADVNSMYNELRETFGYIIVGEQPLAYRGEYTGDTCFVDGYDIYEAKKNDKDMKVFNPLNVIAQDWDGTEFITTSLKTAMLGEDTIAKFDDSIMEGRNLQPSDFHLKKSTDTIKVVLGSNYQSVYQIGDTLTLDLMSKLMTFEVVGFYKPGVCFSMDVGAQHEVNFDNTIVIPHLFFDYEPVDSAELWQHSFLAGEKLSGYIKIEEKTADINEATFDTYSNEINKIADKYGISNLYKLPYRPVGFVWDDLKNE